EPEHHPAGGVAPEREDHRGDQQDRDADPPLVAGREDVHAGLDRRQAQGDGEVERHDKEHRPSGPGTEGRTRSARRSAAGWRTGPDRPAGPGPGASGATPTAGTATPPAPRPASTRSTPRSPARTGRPASARTS